MQKNPQQIVLFLAAFLIADPLLRLLSFKVATGMSFELVWDNIITNGSVSIYRFLEFWLLTPLAGMFLLTFSASATLIYGLLTLYKVYALLSYEAYAWPYFSPTPHAGAIVITAINFIFVLILFWPVLKKYLLSYYLKDIWDARGRYECNYAASLFVHGQSEVYRGYIKNISSGGVLFNLYQGDGQKLRVENEGLLVIELEDRQFLSVEIRLVNVSISKKFDLFGMEFTNIDPRLSLVILKILMELRKKKLMAQVVS